MLDSSLMTAIAIEEDHYSSADIARFWSKVLRTDSCWIWQGNCSRQGYGKFKVRGKQRTAPRVVWEMERGPIPPKMCVCHNCPGGDNPSCVNPAHLWLGTIGDNTRDMRNKGSLIVPDNSGEQNGRAKLTRTQVEEIRRTFNLGRHTKQALATQYGVSHPTIRDILSSRRWP